ncbi:MAG: AMP-binding protein, partial [bacterium]|nr:AMP-binding protein [bacterium]
FAMESKAELFFVVEYSTTLFKKESIERIVTYLMRILTVISEKPETRIAEIDLLSREEKKQILFDFNETEAEYPQDKTIHELFTGQMLRTPDHVALTGQIPNSKSQIQNTSGDGHLSYKELNEKSHQLAHLLQEKGVRPDTIVAIMADRSIEMVTSLLGILKAGGAFLPLDPQYPRKRIDYMLADSNAKILVTNRSLAKEGEKAGTLEGRKNLEIVLLDTSTLPSYHPHPEPWVNEPASVTSLAYVIYTSGSTGIPKGVMIHHQGIVNYTWA